MLLYPVTPRQTMAGYFVFFISIFERAGHNFINVYMNIRN